MRRALLPLGLALATALACSVPGRAGIAEIRDARGHLVAAAGPGSFASVHDAAGRFASTPPPAAPAASR